MGKIYDSIGINQREIEQSSKQIRKLERALRKNISQAKVIVPFTMYGGFKDFSEIGELGTLNRINDQSSYQRVFTGKSSVVAIWDNSVELVNKPLKLDDKVTVNSGWTYYDSSASINANTVMYTQGRISRGGYHVFFDKNNYHSPTPIGNIPDDAIVIFNHIGKLYMQDGTTPVTWGYIKDKIETNTFQIRSESNDPNIAVFDKYILEDVEKISSKVLTKEFKLGDYLVGVSFSTSFTSNVDTFSSGKDFTEMHDTETITIVVPATQFSEDDMYKVYVIPQETQRWLRITDINRIKDTSGNVVFCELTFSSFNDDIEVTGLSQYNYIQRAAIGENYAWPVIDEDTINFEVKGGEGINEYQVEFMGNVLIHGIGFIGRNADENKINEPKWLLTSEILPPIESQVKRVSASENNLTLLRDVKFTEKTYFKNWKEEMAQGYDATIRKQYEGMISFDNKKTVLNSTMADKSIWSNDVIYDLTGGPISYNGFASPYVRKNYTVNSETVPGLLNRNLLSSSWITQLPQEVEETIAWRATDIPIIGKILGLFTQGIPFGWKNSNTLMKTSGLNMLGSRAQALMYSTAIFSVVKEGTGDTATETGLIPVEAFDNTEDNPIGQITASKSVSIVIRGKLTDTITKNSLDKDTATMKSTFNSYDEGTTPKNVSGKYWYIDKHVINSIGKCDYIVSFYRDGVRKWSSRYQTTAKWTDNMRDWLNFSSYSPWIEFEADFNGINWNHIETLPVPSGASFYEPKVFVSSERTMDDVDTISGITPKHRYSREIKWQISKQTYDRYTHVSIPGLTNWTSLTKASFESFNGQNIHNWAPRTHLYSRVEFTIDKTDQNYVVIKIIYVGETYGMNGGQYNDFLTALGNQLRQLVLLNV